MRAQSASNGSAVLSASKAAGLNPDGESVTVFGSGYDTEKGIYIALCVMPAPGQMPSPCGGGADLGGTTSASAWISSNPPSYGEGLAIPYGDGGTFTVSITVAALIGNSHDCRVTQCAIVSRSDHTRLSDRSQDVLIPVSFAQPAATPTPIPPETATPAPSATATSTPTATATPTGTPAASMTPSPSASPGDSPSPAASPSSSPAASSTPAAASTVPAAKLSSDGRTATAGSLSLSLSNAGPAAVGERVTVSGEGFDEEIGLYVALCVRSASGAAPGPCASGSADTSAWISSNAPGYASDLARPYDDGGSFEVMLTLNPVVAPGSDCRLVDCVVATRHDDYSAPGRSQELAVPVTFGDEAAEAVAAAGSDDSGGGSPVVLFSAIAALVVSIAATAFYMLKRRRAGAAVALLLLGLILGACGSSSVDEEGATADASSAVTEPGALPVTVRSADGRDVTITDATRIVSLWGNVTEVLFELGAGASVVGRDVTSTVPEEAGDLPAVTTGHDTSAEGVLSLRPTLVLGSLDNTGPPEVLDHIRNVGIPVVLFEDPESVDDIVPRIREIARAAGIPAAGEELAASTERDLAAVEAGLPEHADRLSVAFLYMRGQAGVYLIGGPGSGADSMIEAAGGLDAGTEMGLGQPFTPITSEALALAAPDVILVTTTGLASVGGVEGLLKIPGIAQTPAGVHGRVVSMEDQLLYSFGPRTPLAIETLNHDIYGEASR